MSRSLSEQYKIGFTPFLHILHVHHTYLQSVSMSSLQHNVLLFTNQCIQGKNANTSKSCQWYSPSVCRYQYHRSSACNTTTTTIISSIHNSLHAQHQASVSLSVITLEFPHTKKLIWIVQEFPASVWLDVLLPQMTDQCIHVRNSCHFGWSKIWVSSNI